MHVTRNTTETGRGPADWFMGEVFIDTGAESALGAAAVHFTPGARTAWHTHPHGQTIWVTEGVGLCQREGGPIEVILPATVSSSSRERTTGTAPRRTGS